MDACLELVDGLEGILVLVLIVVRLALGPLQPLLHNPQLPLLLGVGAHALTLVLLDLGLGVRDEQLQLAYETMPSYQCHTHHHIINPHGSTTRGAIDEPVVFMTRGATLYTKAWE